MRTMWSEEMNKWIDKESDILKLKDGAPNSVQREYYKFMATSDNDIRMAKPQKGDEFYDLLISYYNVQQFERKNNLLGMLIKDENGFIKELRSCASEKQIQAFKEMYKQMPEMFIVGDEE